MTDFSKIIFDAPSHTYQVSGMPLTSVTKVLGEIKPVFDSDGISKKVAAKSGESQESVLASWEAKKQKALIKGSAVHAHAEDVILDRGSEESDSIIELGNDGLPEVAAFRRAWKHLQDKYDAKVEKSETRVADEELGVAGTIDVIAELHLSSPFKCVFDYKTGKQFNSRSFFKEKLLPPFDDLDNCELEVYSLQTSIYRLILERNTDMRLGDSFLIYLPPSGDHYFFRGRDYRERCERWLLDRQGF